jgi:hypothetical protein
VDRPGKHLFTGANLSIDEESSIVHLGCWLHQGRLQQPPAVKDIPLLNN